MPAVYLGLLQICLHVTERMLVSETLICSHENIAHLNIEETGLHHITEHNLGRPQKQILTLFGAPVTAINRQRMVVV